jgi:type IX secretion system PorP/SprF family membrane protein
MSLGGRIYNQSEGLFNFVTLFADYSYVLKVRKDQTIRFGLSTGLVSNQINHAAIIADDPSAIIEVANRNFKGMYFESAVGVLYTWDKFELSISLPQLFGSKRGFNPDYYSFISYNFYIKPYDIEIKPSILTRFNAQKPFLYDINIQSTWKKKVFAGLAYRNRPGIILSTGFYLKDFMLAYAMEFGLQKQSSIFSQIHEISMSYAFKKKNGQIQKQPDDPILPIITDTNNGKTDSTENSEMPPKKFAYKLTETGKGLYVLSLVPTDSISDNNPQQYILSQDPDKLIDPDSALTSQILEKLKLDTKNNKFSISDLGKGLYAINIENNQLDSADNQTNKLIFEHTDEMANEIIYQINSGISQKQEEHAIEFYSIELLINESNKNLLRDAEISINTRFESDKDGNISYFYGNFKSEAEAREAIKKLSKFENLHTRLILLKANK